MLESDRVLVEKSINESEVGFSELFDNISNGVIVYESSNDGEDFLVKDINKAGEEIIKTDQKAIIGKKVSDVFPGIKELGLFDVLRRVWNTGKSEYHPISKHDNKGIINWIESYVYKLPSGLIVSILTDLSEQKRAEEALKKSEEKLKGLKEELEQEVRKRITILNRMIELNPYAIGLYDPEGFFIRGNKAFIEYFKTQPSKEYSIFEDPILIKGGFNDGIKQKIKNGEVAYVPEIWYKLKNISPDIPELNVCFRTTIFSIFDDTGKIENIVFMFDDVTENTLTDQKLKDSEEKYRKAFLQANLYRDIFAHDINNILQNIHSSAELSSLYLNNPEKLNTISELYEIIHEQVERGRKLIKNVRKINEIENSEIELKKIEIFGVLNIAIEFLKNSFQARTLDIKINTQEKKSHVYANNLLLDVFENILINAVRHNSSTKIEIEIEIKKEKVKTENYIRIEFNDNGIGISDFRKKNIFEKGGRKDQRSRGLGLGLSLVRKIIDSYQGKIWVEDRIKGEYKQGSKFIILLHEIL